MVSLSGAVAAARALARMGSQAADEEALFVPGAQAWMKVMAAAMAQHGGDRETARFLWSRIYESAEDPSIRTNAAQHLRALQVADEVEALEKLVAAYRQRTGHAPASFEDLI